MAPARPRGRKPARRRIRGRAGFPLSAPVHPQRLSGPATLQASCFWAAGRSAAYRFLPGHPALELCTTPGHGKNTVLGLFKKVLPTRLAERLIPESLASKKVAQLAKKDREHLASAIHNHTVTPSRSEGMGHAEAAAGGVDTGDVNPRTLESRRQPGLYFAGEVLDVTGLLGRLQPALGMGFGQSGRGRLEEIAPVSRNGNQAPYAPHARCSGKGKYGTSLH